eukprot:TRINITY_DN16824_c0_g1_i3.p1 TRINITY_DN16824_c0_g1~~TRINITY_DN16824_c0_g1_i3.p1  ORF type:complete len:330 (+),score=85.22 TRINITY_DN16824_c0_g1_i3:66-992(+)
MAPGAGEEVVFETSLEGPQLEDGWQWIREDSAPWAFGESCLEFTMKPGGLWGQVFADQPPALLLRRLGNANACEVTVLMPPGKGGFGEQAGLFWYFNDNNYAKLVVEWMQDGTAAVVLARERSGEPAVCGTAALDSEEAAEPIRLRLEMNADGTELSGVMVGAYYNRLIGSCQAGPGTWGDNATGDADLQFGVSAHGGSASGESRAARFSKFSALAVKANRVQWGGGAGMPQQFAGGVVTPLASPVDGQGDFAAAPPGGWTLSGDLSDEQRAQIAAMLGGMNLADAEAEDEAGNQGAAPNQPGPNEPN